MIVKFFDTSKWFQCLVFAVMLSSFSSCRTNSFLTNRNASDLSHKQAISLLKEGTLVIRVPMQQRKLDTLASIIDRKKLSKGSGLAIKYRVTESERNEYLDSLRSELKQHYRFSNYKLLPDYNYLEILDGKKDKSLFLPKELDGTLTTDLEGEFLFLLLDRVTKTKDFVVVDAAGKVILPPFPNEAIHYGTYRNRGNGLSKFFRSFSNITKSEKELNLLDLEYGIEELNTVLNIFYKNPEATAVPR